MNFKSGFVAILGRPNAGKSTLVNALVGYKVAIVSNKPQTTRNRIQGIVNRPNAQMVLVDTPGIHRAETALDRQMMSEVEQALDGVDILCLIADATRDFGPIDRYSLDWMRRHHGPLFLLLNKIDRVKDKRELLPRIDTWRREHEFAEIIPISALTGNGLEVLVTALVDCLPEGQPLFPEDQLTDQPRRFLAAEIVREKVLATTREEVPHAVAVLAEAFEEGESLARIRATIYVEKGGQKGIIIGAGGAKLKQIGTDARQELEGILGTKVFLELRVKVQPDWRQNPAVVRQLDWRRQLEQLGKE